MLTIPQVAARLGLSKTRIHEFIRAGRLPATKPGRDWLITPEDLAAFAAIPRRPGHPGHREKERPGEVR